MEERGGRCGREGGWDPNKGKRMERRRETTRGEEFLVRAGRPVEDAGSTDEDEEGWVGVRWVLGSEERRVGELGQSFRA